MRWAWCGVLVGALALAAPGQEAKENPGTPREFSRCTAKVIARYPEVCSAPVLWVIAFDMSRSGMGQWNEWARQVVSDLITYVMCSGDKLVLIPFDCVVNPPRGKWPGGADYPHWQITDDAKGTIRSEVAELLLWRKDSPDGTSWVDAAAAALKTCAAVKSTDPDKLGLCLLISDRDSADLVVSERTTLKKISGTSEPGQSLWPLPGKPKPIVVFHAVSNARPATSTHPQRYIPPKQPGAQPDAGPLLPTPPPQGRRLPWVWWLLAAALIVLGVWLVPAALAARRKVGLRWGFFENDPARQVTVELPVGEPRLLSAAAQPSPDPFCVWADGAANDVQRRAVLQGLGSITPDADGLLVGTSDLYLLRPAGEAAWANQARTRRGDAPLYLEFRLVSETWPLTRRPIGLEALPKGRDWLQRLVIGSVAILLGLIILLSARPTQPPPSVPLPGPSAGPADAPDEPLCGAG